MKMSELKLPENTPDWLKKALDQMPESCDFVVTERTMIISYNDTVYAYESDPDAVPLSKEHFNLLSSWYTLDVPDRGMRVLEGNIPTEIEDDNCKFVSFKLIG